MLQKNVAALGCAAVVCACALLVTPAIAVDRVSGQQDTDAVVILAQADAGSSDGSASNYQRPSGQSVTAERSRDAAVGKPLPPATRPKPIAAGSNAATSSGGYQAIEGEGNIAKRSLDAAEGTSSSSR